MSDEQTQATDDPSGPGNQLANRIRAAMLASGLTRYQLSQQTGIAQSVLGRFASGERDLTLNTTSRLVPALGLDLMATDTSDSEPETMEQLRDEVATLTFELMAERDSGMIALQQLRERLATSHKLAEMSRRQVEDEAGKVELLKEQVATLTRELKAERDNSMTALRSQHRLGREAAAEALQTWLRPALELVAEHPDDCSPLAVAVLGYLPGIASRLIEE